MSLDWDSADDRVVDKTFNLHLFQIEEHLYLGDGWGGLCIPETLQEANIKAILSVVDTRQTLPEPKPSAIEYHTLVLDSNGSNEDLLIHLPSALATIKQYVSRGESILVYCITGTAKSTSVVVAYLMAKYGISIRGGQQIVAAKRRLVSPTHGFEAQLTLFETMGYTLDANHRPFRQYLLNMYVTDVRRVDDYLECLATAEGMTSGLDLGVAYGCNRCRTELFREIHVIKNECNENQENRSGHSEPDNQWCDRWYIEPRPWMSELLATQNGGADCHVFEGLVKCVGCLQPVARVEPWVRRFGCNCIQHSEIQCLIIHLIDNRFKVKT